MCGIYGYSLKNVKISNERKAMFGAVLAVANDTRGGDSWGFYNGEHLVKGLGDITSVAIKTIEKDVLMAHTRKATTGTINTMNAHPFDIGNIIGAHNGIITNHYELKTKYNREYEVDSMHLFAHLDEKLPFDDIEGYGAIEFIKKDDKKNRIFLCKLSGGDLSICGLGKGVKNYNGVVWSSSESHLTAALESAGLDFFQFKVEPELVYYVQNDRLFISDDKLKLAQRKSFYMPDWRNGFDYSSKPERLTSEAYEDMLDKMDDQEEIHFRELWEMEMAKDELEDELEDEASEIENDLTRRVKEDFNDDWPDEEFKHTHRLNGSDMVEESEDEDWEFMPGEGWVKVQSDGTLIAKRD